MGKAADFAGMAGRPGDTDQHSQVEPVSQSEREVRQRAKLRSVSVSKLRAHPTQPAERHADEAIQALVASIRTLGLINPPVVRRLEDGTYQILVGHRRSRSWQLLVLLGEVPERIKVYVYDDLSDADAILMIAAEYGQGQEYSAVHTSVVVGEAVAQRRAQLGRDPTAREMADILPWGKTSINDYERIYDALCSPIGNLVRRADSAGKSLLLKALEQDELTTRRALEAFPKGGEGGVRKILQEANGKGGRPQNPFTRTKRGKGWNLTVRLRPTMEAAAAEAVEEQLRQALEFLEAEVGAGS